MYVRDMVVNIGEPEDCIFLNFAKVAWHEKENIIYVFLGRILSSEYELDTYIKHFKSDKRFVQIEVAEIFEERYKK